MQGNRKVLNLLVLVLNSCAQMSPSINSGFGTKQNRRKTLRKLVAEIDGLSLAYGLELHLRGNSKVLGRMAILFFDEGGVLGWRG
jgi:hypothetical protein